MLMQFAFQDALYESTSIIQSSLLGELVLISTKTRTISAMRSFPRHRLYEALGIKEVVSVTPIYVGYANWKNPQDGTSHLILALGLEPTDPALNVPGIEAGRRYLAQEDTVLFDRLSRDEYGPIAQAFDRKDPVFVEINNRRTEVAGLVDVGHSLQMATSSPAILVFCAYFHLDLLGWSILGSSVCWPSELRIRVNGVKRLQRGSGTRSRIQR